MKHRNQLITLLAIVCLLSSCDSVTKNNKLIIGNWDGAEWLVNGNQSDLNTKDTHFTFNDKEEYTYEYVGTKQTGTYKVEKDMLFTTPKGEQEIMVKIIKLTKDSLVFDMNRSGQPETLTLIRKQ
ncbi:MAG: lipocalin family protein [Chitinophagaceae bacterium]